ncbi:stage VI sporulation protein D [Halobacillus yeomjeoni]|uniref:stage VI sporulation protein D n=1 Tax=Halobacillus yeomjeoni TaxID=311194 RepID=UPI001CD698B7|nr:stage VI sporulation protein D [Halobacillus yeomjeoni]MCA0982584.1 stage VI sporulation protein D [Halobacillus yeomjeoni]
MHKNQNVFSFYLDESLWFKEGQGVKELVGISLEPDITLEERGDEVCLKGSVALVGEYVAVSSEDRHEDHPQLQALKFIHDVQRQQDGLCEFSHSFPVEIIVPLERVSNLNDVLVDIDSFDYELPSSQQLRLQAQMNINGVEQKQAESSNFKGFDDTKTAGPVDFKQNKEERFSFPEREAPVTGAKKYENPEPQDDAAGRWNSKKSQSLSEFFGHKQEEVTEAQEDFSQNMEVESAYQSYEQEELPKEESQEGKGEAPGGMDGIKQIFKHLFPNREESFTQMKMYIVQDNETLESIAEKYELPVKQLERYNTDQEDLSPGQIVYIPN